VVNEEAVKLMGMDSPLGKRLSVFRKEGRIIGVVKNYHFQPLHYPILPLLLGMNQNWGRDWMFIKYKQDNLSETLAYTDKVFKQFDPDYPAEPTTMERHFFKEALDYSYQAEKQVSQFASYFTILAILISCLGLFGLASFIAQQRTKEIGIRKVLGASVPKVVLMLSKDFTKWVILSNLFAWPIAYLVTQKMLVKFAYRTNVGLEIYTFSGLLALLIALLTISYQAIRTAQTNPVDSLKYE
jgi:putative ABC transport system permease protein